MNPQQAERWAALVERKVLGETLSREDEAWFSQMEQSEPECGLEAAFLDELSDAVEGGADPHAAALARAALAELDAGPVEPEATVEPPKRSRRGLWIASGVAAAAAAALVLAFVLPGDSQRGTAETSEVSPSAAPMIASLGLAAGDVYVDGRPASEVDVVLGEGSTIAVGDASEACLALDGSIEVCLAPSTTATLRDLETDAPWVAVGHGHAVARLEPQREGRTFSLGTDTVRATAIGTIFALDVQPERDEVTASVLQGRVQVQVAGEMLELGAHETVMVVGETIERGTLASADEMADLARIGRSPGTLADARGRVVVDCTPPGADVIVDGTSLGTSPVTAMLPVGAHRLELVADGRVRLHETVTVDSEAEVRRKFALPVEDTGETEGETETETEPEIEPELESESGDEPEARAVPEATAAEMIAEARRLRTAGQWSKAARAYVRLRKAHPRSAEAHAALVSLGDLQLDKLGKARAAAKSYERYLAKGGALALEARNGRVRAYRALGDSKREAEAIRSLLAAHPSSGRAPALRRRLSDLGG